MITVENLSFTYRKSKRAVLRDFSLSFESGRVYGLLVSVQKCRIV